MFVSFLEGFMSEFAVGKAMPWYFHFMGAFPLVITHAAILAIFIFQYKKEEEANDKN